MLVQMKVKKSVNEKLFERVILESVSTSLLLDRRCYFGVTHCELHHNENKPHNTNEHTNQRKIERLKTHIQEEQK